MFPVRRTRGQPARAARVRQCHCHSWHADCLNIEHFTAARCRPHLYSHGLPGQPAAASLECNGRWMGGQRHQSGAWLEAWVGGWHATAQWPRPAAGLTYGRRNGAAHDTHDRHAALRPAPFHAPPVTLLLTTAGPSRCSLRRLQRQFAILGFVRNNIYRFTAQAVNSVGAGPERSPRVLFYQCSQYFNDTGSGCRVRTADGWLGTSGAQVLLGELATRLWSADSLPPILVLQCKVSSTGCAVKNDDRCSCKTCANTYKADGAGGCTKVNLWAAGVQAKPLAVADNTLHLRIAFIAAGTVGPMVSSLKP